MSIPLTPVFYDMKYVESDGSLTSQAMQYNDSLYQTLNVVVDLMNDVITSNIVFNGTVIDSSTNEVSNGTTTNNGIVAPNKTAAEITALESSALSGTLWFDTDNDVLKLYTAAGTKTIVTL